MATLTTVGAVAGLEEVGELFTWPNYNVLAQSTNLPTVPMIMIQLSMIMTSKIGVSLVGTVTIAVLLANSL